MPRAHIDTSQLDTLARDLEGGARTLRGRANQVLREVAVGVEREVKSAMPVKTGRARASWGHWTPGDVVDSKSGASEADAHFEVGVDYEEQGSNLPYIESLNAGHSKQAPAGFLDTAWVRGEEALTAAIAQLVEQVAVGR